MVMLSCVFNIPVANSTQGHGKRVHSGTGHNKACATFCMSQVRLLLACNHLKPRHRVRSCYTTPGVKAQAASCLCLPVCFCTQRLKPQQQETLKATAVVLSCAASFFVEGFLLKPGECGVWSDPPGPLYLLMVHTWLLPFLHLRIDTTQRVLTIEFVIFLITAFAK